MKDDNRAPRLHNLVLEMRVGDSIFIGRDVQIDLMASGQTRVRLCVRAPRYVPIHRLAERVQPTDPQVGLSDPAAAAARRRELKQRIAAHRAAIDELDQELSMLDAHHPGEVS